MTGQASRDLLLKRLETSELGDIATKNEFDFVADKLNITVGELNELFSAPNKTFSDYRNKKRLIDFGAKFLQSIGLEKRLCDDTYNRLWLWECCRLSERL